MNTESAEYVQETTSELSSIDRECFQHLQMAINAVIQTHIQKNNQQTPVSLHIYECEISDTVLPIPVLVSETLVQYYKSNGWKHALWCTGRERRFEQLSLYLSNEDKPKPYP